LFGSLFRVKAKEVGDYKALGALTVVIYELFIYLGKSKSDITSWPGQKNYATLILINFMSHEKMLTWSQPGQYYFLHRFMPFKKAYKCMRLPDSAQL
jgi:hypothetical protein